MISLSAIVAQALRDPGSLAKLRRALCSTLANPNPFYRAIVEFVGGFWDQYKVLPKIGDFELWYTAMEEPRRSGILQALAEILNQPVGDWTPDYFSQTVVSELRNTATRSAIARVNQLIPNVTPEVLAELSSEVQAVDAISIEGLKDLRDVEKYVYPGIIEVEGIPTGISQFDRLTGGFRPGELIFVLADSGVGKSTALMNFGAAAALKGKHVLHLTFELSAENLLRRYYRKITESTGTELYQTPGVVIDRARHWLRFAKGSVHVLYQPSYSVGSSELEALVDQFVQIHGGIDLLILDYLDLMKPEAGVKSEYEGLGKLSHKARNTGTRRGAATLSATQATRSANQARHIRMDMMGDSYKKIQAADIVASLAQTQREFEANQARLGLPKVREAPGRGIEIPLYCNMDLMLMAELDSPNSRRLAELYKHPTTRVSLEDSDED